MPLFVSVVLLFVPTATQFAAAADQEVVKTVADKIAAETKKQLTLHSQTSVAVGEFTGPARALPNGLGLAIQYALIRSLETSGVTIDRKARFELKGDFTLQIKEGSAGLRVSPRLIDTDNSKADELSMTSDYCSVYDLLILTGATANIALPQWRDQYDDLLPTIIQAAQETPAVFVSGSEMRSKKESPFGVEILVKQRADGPTQAVTPRVENGMAYAPIGRDQFYEVRVINRSEYEVGVTLTIDGLDLFTFSDIRSEKTGEPKYRRLVFAKGQSYAVQGWYRTGDRADSFVVTSYAKSAAAEKLVKPSGRTGTITVTFAAAWNKKEGKPPADEPGKRKRPSVSGDGTGRGDDVQQLVQGTGRGKEVETQQLVQGTGRGKEVETQLQEATSPYEHGVIRDVVTVRYAK